jgi:hypothetical protein
MTAVPTTGDHTLAVRHDDRHDLLVVAVRGPLSSSGGAALPRAVHTHLLDRGRVVVDLSGTTFPWGPVAGVFPEALAAAGADASCTSRSTGHACRSPSATAGRSARAVPRSWSPATGGTAC